MAAGNEAGTGVSYPKSISEALGYATNVASIGTAVSFLLSLVHEQAYFFVVGGKFQDFASLSDYLSNVLDWLPAATAILVAYAMMSLALEMLFPGWWAAQQKAAEKYTTREALPRLLVGFAMGAFGIAFGYFAADPASSDLSILSSSGFFFFWAMVVTLVVKLSGQVVGTTWHSAVIFGPVAVFAVYVSGLQNGYRDLSQRGQGYSLVRDESPQSVDAVNLLRVFERGILVRYPDQEINEFIRWEKIRSVKLPQPGEAGKTLFCRQYPAQCSPL
jgi:hypothetical protein